MILEFVKIIKNCGFSSLFLPLLLLFALTLVVNKKKDMVGIQNFLAIH
jgi:hypothetical protein